jgi:hypothetical protein
MRTALIVASLAIIAAPALAAPSDNTDTGSNPQSNAQPGTPGQQVAQQVRQNLQDAGFSDIKLMPSSFMVRAKDKSGNAVMMVINPDSITAVRFQSNSGSSNDQPNMSNGSNQPNAGNGPNQPITGNGSNQPNTGNGSNQ